MKRLRFGTITMLIAAIVFLGSTQLQAQKGKNCDKTGQGQCKIPNLTDDQAKQISGLKVSHQKEMLQFRNQMQEKRARLNTLRTADKPDMAAINKVVEEMGGLHTQMMKKREAHRQDVRKLLTEEQKVFFDSRPGRGQGHGFGRHHGKGHIHCRGNGKGMGHRNCPNK